MGGMAEPTAEAIGDVQAAFKADPAVAMCCYKAKSVLVEGLCTSLSFPNTPEHGPYPVDEPPMMPGGKDAGPNPMDLCLGALGTCQEIAYKAYATAMGIPLRSVACELSGDLDLAGFLGVDPDAPRGFTKITGTVTVDADATEEQLAMLKGAVDGHCPMCDFLVGTCSMTLTTVVASPEGLDAPKDENLTAEAVGDLQAALGADRSAGRAVYKSSSKLEAGLKTTLSFPNTPHHGPYVVDEPESMPGGQNAGPNPLDLLLGSLATCQDISYKAYATAMGIQLFKIETDIEGDCDLRGFLGVAPAVRAGFQAIRGTVKLYTTASEDQVKMLKGAVDAHCPMCATVTNKGGPEIALVKKASERL